LTVVGVFPCTKKMTGLRSNSDPLEKVCSRARLPGCPREGEDDRSEPPNGRRENRPRHMETLFSRPALRPLRRICSSIRHLSGCGHAGRYGICLAKGERFEGVRWYTQASLMGVAGSRRPVDIGAASCIVSALQCIPRGHYRKFSLPLFWKLLPHYAFRNELQFIAT